MIKPFTIVLKCLSFPFKLLKKTNEKLVYSNLQDRKVKQEPKYKLGQRVRTADTKIVFSKGDSTNFSNRLYTTTEVIHDTRPSYRHEFLTVRYNENLLLPTKLSLDEYIKL